MLTARDNAADWSRTVASLMEQIENDAALASLIDEDRSAGASEFRVQVRHIGTLALVGQHTMEKEDLRQAVRELDEMCVGRLQRWQTEIRRARLLIDG